MINFGVTERKRQELELRMHKCNLHENDIEEKFVRSSGAGDSDRFWMLDFEFWMRRWKAGGSERLRLLRHFVPRNDRLRAARTRVAGQIEIWAAKT